MKKLLSIVLSLALALSLSVSAFAAGEDDTGGTDTSATTSDTTITQDSTTQAGSTNVNYSVAPAYTVTIPASVTIDSSAVTVSASNVALAKGKQVVVRLTGINETTTNGSTTSDNEFKVKTAEGAELKYTVKDASGNTISKDGTVLTVDPSTTTSEKVASGSTSLTFALAENEVVQYAGTYTGTVTFTVSVESASSSSTTETTP